MKWTRILPVVGFVVGAGVAQIHCRSLFPPPFLLPLQLVIGGAFAWIGYASARQGSAPAKLASPPPDSQPKVVVLNLVAPGWKLQEYRRKFTPAEVAELTAIRDREALANLVLTWLLPGAGVLAGALWEKPWNWLVAVIAWIFALILRRSALPTLRKALASLREDLAYGEVEGSLVEGQTPMERLRGSQLSWTGAEWRSDPQGYLKSLVWGQHMGCDEGLERRLCNLLVTLARDEGVITLTLGSEVEFANQGGTVTGQGSPELVDPLRECLEVWPSRQVLRIDGQPHQVLLHSTSPDRYQFEVEADLPAAPSADP